MNDHHQICQIYQTSRTSLTSLTSPKILHHKSLGLQFHLSGTPLRSPKIPDGLDFLKILLLHQIRNSHLNGGRRAYPNGSLLRIRLIPSHVHQSGNETKL